MIRAILLVSVAIAFVASDTEVDTVKSVGLEQLVKDLLPSEDRIQVEDDRDGDAECKKKFNIRGNRCVCWPSGKTVPC